MAALRFLAALFAVVAILALVADVTPRLSGRTTFEATSIETHWEKLSPSTLKGARESLSQTVSPFAWNVLEKGVLELPTFVLFGGLAALFGYVGRRRSRVNVYVN